MTAATLAGAAALRRRYSHEGYGSRRCRSLGQTLNAGYGAGRTASRGDGWAVGGGRTVGHNRRGARATTVLLPPSGEAFYADVVVGPSAQAVARARSAEREATWAQRQQKLKEFQRDCQRRVAQRRAEDRVRAAAATPTGASPAPSRAEPVPDAHGAAPQASASSTAAATHHAWQTFSRASCARSTGLPEARLRRTLARQSFAAVFEGTGIGANPTLESRPQMRSPAEPSAMFRVIESYEYEKMDQLGDPEFAEGSELSVRLSEAVREVQAAVRSLAPGAIVRITYQHDQVGTGTSAQDAICQERCVTQVRLIRPAEAREVLSRQTFSAIFEGTKPGRGQLTNMLAPNSQPTTLAVFRVIANHGYEHYAECGDREHTVGSDFLLSIGEAPVHIQEAVRALQPGAPVRITYLHEEVDVGGKKHSERSVTHFSITGDVDSEYERDAQDAADLETLDLNTRDSIVQASVEGTLESTWTNAVQEQVPATPSFNEAGEALTVPGLTCRNCGNTGLDILGQPCSCVYGQRLSQPEEWVKAAATGGLTLGESGPAVHPDVKIDTQGRGEDASTSFAAGRSSPNEFQDVVVEAAGHEQCEDTQASSSASHAEDESPSSSLRLKRLFQTSQAALATHARAEPSIHGSASKGPGSLSSGGEKAARYTSGLLSLLLRAYAKRGRSPPALCACVPLPDDPPPAIGPDSHLSQTPAWESYVQRTSSTLSHARNCEFWNNLPRLQRQILVLIHEAKEA